MARIFSQTPDTFNPDANSLVSSIAVQADGKILVGGLFISLGGQACSHIGRLNSDGSLDAAFNPGANSNVWSLAVQPDGKILVAGSFTSLGGQTRNRIGRLNSDGSVDPSFDPGANGSVFPLALQADGKILVGGTFKILAGQTRNSIGRLNSDGSLDLTFNPGADQTVNSVAVQADGKILAGGFFSAFGGQARNGIARVSSDGAVDMSFNPGSGGPVGALVVQPNGKILVGLSYPGSLAGQPRNGIGRLNSDGTLDANFNPNANGSVNAVAVQADGKILVGGRFTQLSGQPRNRIGRLNSDGTLDSTFNPGASDDVQVLAVEAGGKVLAGGFFTLIGGEARNRVARLNNTEPATNSLSFDGSTITWLRDGASPEIWRASFDVSTNGADWLNLGGGERTSGGWRLTGLAFPTNARIRARGFVSGGTQSGLNYFVESFSGPPLILNQPVSQTNNAGALTSLEVRADGTPPLGFQWRKDGVSLVDGGTVSGVRTSMLKLAGAWGADVGGYEVVVSNLYGSVTSLVARLSIRDPFIVVQPVSRSSSAGTLATFTVQGGGTLPLLYQWVKGTAPLNDGGGIFGAHTDTLRLTNVLHASVGEYSVVLSNASGSLTSSVVTLSVLDPFISRQPASQTTTPGETVQFSVAVAGTEPLSYLWSKNGANLNDGGNVSGAGTPTLTLSTAAFADAGAYSVSASNGYGSVTSIVAALTVNLAPPDSLNPGANASVFPLAMQADGRILVGGTFSTLAGQPRKSVGRIEPDGTLDGSFSPDASALVDSLAVQEDGKILLGGFFTTIRGQTRNHIGRLNADGTLDTTFNPGADFLVNCLGIQADGKILVGGSFGTLGGQPRKNIGRLNADGSLDSTFDPGASYLGVYTLAMQADGKILVGGDFSLLGGQTRGDIGRLNPDGSLDTTFDPRANGVVYSIAVQADGKILVGGQFSTLSGQPRGRIGRLNPDGTLDTFNPGANSTVNCLRVQTDGMILVGGQFTTLGGQARNYVGRLNADGTIEPTFNPGANNYVTSLALQQDGKVLIGGSFTSLGGQSRSAIGRLNNTEPATENLTFDGSTITWLRGGAGPEIWRSTFAVSTNGADWAGLGDGARIPGGWKLPAVSFVGNVTLRARGFISGGGFNSSASWFVENKTQVTGQPRPIIFVNNGSFGVISRRFGFDAGADAGRVVVVEASTNFLGWLPLLTNTSANTTFHFSDANTTNFPKRFYRLRFP